MNLQDAASHDVARGETSQYLYDAKGQSGDKGQWVM